MLHRVGPVDRDNHNFFTIGSQNLHLYVFPLSLKLNVLLPCLCSSGIKIFKLQFAK